MLLLFFRYGSTIGLAVFGGILEAQEVFFFGVTHCAVCLGGGGTWNGGAKVWRRGEFSLEGLSLAQQNVAGVFFCGWTAEHAC